MSFSSEVKSELSRIFSNDEKALLAELSALIRTTGSLKIVGLNKLAFAISTENPAVARKVFTLIKKCFDINVQIQINKAISKKVYSLNVNYEQGANHILDKAGIIDIEDGYISFLDNIPKELLSKQESKRAYIRGTFLGSGSLTDPQKLYHMEFASTDLDSIKKLSKVLNSYSINAKIIERKNMKVLYIKDSEKISDVLNIMGAHKALLKYENIRTKKQLINNVNRQNNCENANIDKIIQTSQRHIKNIDYIIRKKGMKYLPENLREIAKARKKYFDADMTELGQKLKEPLGKSGVNYRLKKIEDIAEKLRETLGEKE